MVSALFMTLLAGAFFLVGALVAWRASGSQALEDISLAVAFGALFCVAAVDLVPEALEAAEELGAPWAIGLAVAGVVVLVVLDRALPDHHHVEEGSEGVSHVGAMAVLAISVHNLAEGAAIYAIAQQDISSGLALACGVGLHNAPMGMLLYSTFQRGRAKGVFYLASAALSTFVGGLLMFALGGAIDESAMLCVVCVALGMIAYILVAELLPSLLRSGKPARSIAGVVVGAAFVLVGMLFE